MREVLQNNAVRCGEEGKDMLDEMTLVFVKLFPILDVLGEVDFFCGPKGGLLVLVHLPDVIVLDGEEHEAVRVLLEQWLRKWSLSHLRANL